MPEQVIKQIIKSTVSEICKSFTTSDVSDITYDQIDVSPIDDHQTMGRAELKN